MSVQMLFHCFCPKASLSSPFPHVPPCPGLSRLSRLVPVTALSLAVVQRAGTRRFCQDTVAIADYATLARRTTMLSHRHLSVIKFRPLMRWRRLRQICLRNLRFVRIGPCARGDWSSRDDLSKRVRIGTGWPRVRPPWRRRPDCSERSDLPWRSDPRGCGARNDLMVVS